MLFKDIIGQEDLKRHLCNTADQKRISHAQLLIGPEGSGALPLAIAYAQYILCANSGGENQNGSHACNLQANKLAHPDLHFSYPVNTNAEVKKDPTSEKFYAQWVEFVNSNPYGGLMDWYQHIGIDNKQGLINKNEASSIHKRLSLKSHEGGYKVLIIWHADRMNTEAANQLLKLIEEPPKHTLMLLVTENEDAIIDTILSRCQKVYLKRLLDDDIKTYLQSYCSKSEEEARSIAFEAQGNLNKALKLLDGDPEETEYEALFVKWVRAAFMAKNNPGVLTELVSFTEDIAKFNRERQKKFLQYAGKVFRQALLKQYTAEELVYLQPKANDFNFAKFSQYIHGNNIEDIYNELNDAEYHIERNGNAKIIFLDMSVKITRFLHRKPF